jgi:ribonuclease P protein component
MLRKNHRLPRSLFDTVFARGKSTHSPHFIKKSLPVRSWEEFVVSVVVPKKVARLATSRNRMKRRVYGVVRELIPELKAPERSILILKKNPESMRRCELVAELHNIFGV